MGKRYSWLVVGVALSAGWAGEGCSPEDGAQPPGGPADDGPVTWQDAASPPQDAAAETPDADVEADGGVEESGPQDAAPVDDSPKPPGTGVMHTAAQLQVMRNLRSVQPWQDAHQQVLTEAQTALSRTPEPTENFDIPFYYGDPAASQAAKEGLRQDALAAYALALGYQLAEGGAERDAFASHSIELLTAWATVNKTVSGSDGDLVVLYTGMPLLYAGDLVMNYPGWDEAGRALFLGWVSSVFQNSASRIKDRVNNWGDWGTLGVVASAGIQSDTASLSFEADRIRSRIATGIAQNGELPEENKRTNSGMWYTFFAMTAKTTAAHIIRNTIDVDLFNYVAPNGRSIRLALDREFFYAVHPDEWPYPLPDGLEGELWRLLYPCSDTIEMPSASGWPGTLFEVMSNGYGVEEWEGWVSPFRPLRGYHGWIYPTLMRQAP